MGVVLDNLLAVTLPELSDLLGLTEFLASIGDDYGLSLPG